jgi:hypothetical protein
MIISRLNSIILSVTLLQVRLQSFIRAITSLEAVSSCKMEIRINIFSLMILTLDVHNKGALMNTPILLLGFVISTLYGAAFHFWRGGSLKRLLLYLVLSWFGFWLGHLIGGMLNITFWSIGLLHAGMATIGSFLLLLIGYWFSLIDIQQRS